MFYERLFYTVSLALVNFLTSERKFKIAKVKRDMRSSYIIYFYFEESPELLAAVEEFNASRRFTPEEIVNERLYQIQDGVWRGEKWEDK